MSVCLSAPFVVMWLPSPVLGQCVWLVKRVLSDHTGTPGGSRFSSGLPLHRRAQTLQVWYTHKSIVRCTMGRDGGLSIVVVVKVRHLKGFLKNWVFAETFPRNTGIYSQGKLVALAWTFWHLQWLKKVLKADQTLVSAEEIYTCKEIQMLNPQKCIRCNKVKWQGEKCWTHLDKAVNQSTER